MSRFLFLIVVTLFLNPVFSQENGDFRSRATGNWTSASTWEVYNGTTWVNATQAPQTGFSTTATIRTDHTVTFSFTNQISSFSSMAKIIVDGGIFVVNTPNGFQTVTAQVNRFTINNGQFKVNVGNNSTFILETSEEFIVNGGFLIYEGGVGNDNPSVYFDCKGNAEVNAGLVVNNATSTNLNRSGLYLNGNGTASNPQKLRITSNISAEARRRFYALPSTYVVEEYAGDIEQNTVFGNLSNPRSGYTGLQNKASNLELVIDKTENSIVNLSFPKTVNEVVELRQGQLNNSTNNLTLGTGATIKRRTGTFTSTPNFGTSVNVEYLAHTAPIETSNEIPNTASVLNNLRIDNPFGVKATKDFQVNGIVNLAEPNPENIGLLEMTIDYSGYGQTAYGESGFNDPQSSGNNLDSWTLNLGQNASFVGPGDVTGKIRRAHTLASGVTYTMGNPNTSIRFNANAPSDMPQTLLFVATRGEFGEHIDNNDAELFIFDNEGNPLVGNRNTVKRMYQVMYTSTSPLPPTTRFTLRMSYDDDELNGNDKSSLITWDHHLPYNGVTPHEHGRTANNTDDNWVELSNHSILYLTREDATPNPDPENFSTVVKYWMLSDRETVRDYVWLGAAGGVAGSDWNTISNWSGSKVPNENADVFIPAEVNNQPIINDTSGFGIIVGDEQTSLDDSEVRMRTLEIAPGATLTVEEGSTKNIFIYGGPNVGGEGINYASIDNSGTFNPAASQVHILDDLVGVELATISGKTTFYNLTIGEDARVLMEAGSEIEILNNLVFGNNVDFDAVSNQNTITFSGVDQTVVIPEGENPAFFTLKLNGSGNTVLPTELDLYGDLIVNQADLSLSGNRFNFLGENQFISSETLSELTLDEVFLDTDVLATDIEELSINSLQLENGNFFVSAGNSLLLLDGVSRVNGHIDGLGTVEFKGPNQIDSDLFEDDTYSGNITVNNNDEFTIPNDFTINGNLFMKSGNISLAENSLNIGGNLTNEEAGEVDAKEATIRFIGDASQSIDTLFFKDREIAILENAGLGGPDLAYPLSITNLLRPLNGDIKSNGNLILKASGDRTAQVGIVGLNAVITGDVQTQQFFPARRAFRFVSPSATTSSSIYENWQESAENWTDNPNPGFGTHITGIGSIVPSGPNEEFGGFDWQPSGNPSIFVWDNGLAQWSPLANTNNTSLVAGQPIRLNIRGSRAVDVTSNASPTSNTILRETGVLSQGLVNYTQVDLGFESDEQLPEDKLILVGNPFQSIVNIQQVIDSSTGVKSFVAIWDPRIGGALDTNSNSSTGARGGYVTVDYETGEVVINNSSSNMNQFLQPKQALFFFADGSGNPVNIVFEEGFKSTNENQTSVFSTLGSYLQIDLYDQPSFEANDTADDGIRIIFSPEGNNLIDEKDAKKLSNQDENLARSFGNRLLAIEHRALPENNEVLPLFINQYRDEEYVIKVQNTDLPADTKAYLRDNYLDTFTELEPGQTVIPFSIDNTINASKSFSRFAIVFEVETFSIQDFDKAGFALYPNPVVSNEAWISASSLVGEKVNVRIYDVLGRKVASFREEVGANGQIHLTNLSGSAGVYMVELTTTDKKFTTKYIKK